MSALSHGRTTFFSDKVFSYGLFCGTKILYHRKKLFFHVKVRNFSVSDLLTLISVFFVFKRLVETLVSHRENMMFFSCVQSFVVVFSMQTSVGYGFRDIRG